MVNASELTFVKGFEPRNVHIIHDKGRTLVAAFEGDIGGRSLFNIRELYESYGDYAPGKGVSIPLDKKEEFLKELASYLKSQGINA